MTTRLFHISDVHFGVEDRVALDTVAAAVREEQPDALVCTGDITQRAKHSEYAAAKEWFSNLGVPIWLDPGNHDMPYYNLWERFSKPFSRYLHLKQCVAVEQFETDDLVLAALNTNVPAQKRWPWSDGVVTKDAAANAVHRLSQLCPEGRKVVLTAHHPLHGPKVGGPNPTIGGDEALNQMSQSGVEAVLSGHIHTPFNDFRSAQHRQIQVIGAGTLSTRLRHNAPPSYNVLTYTKGEDAIAVELREV